MPMKVSELIEELKLFDQDAKVIVSIDEEGNGFHELADINPDMRWSGEVDDSPRYPELTEELKNAGYTEEDVSDEGEKVVVLWP